MKLKIKSRLTGNVFTATGEFQSEVFFADDGKIFSFDDFNDTVYLFGSHATFSPAKKWIVRERETVPYFYVDPPRLGSLI